MNIWVVTGGVACGKSAMLYLLLQSGVHGIRHFSADAVVAELLQDAAVKQQIVAQIGEHILTESAEIDRAKLRAWIFQHEDARARLEKLLHPKVFAAFELAQADAKADPEVNLLVAEIPLYYETENEVNADEVIVVACSTATQLRRLTELRQLGNEEANAILKAQLPIATKMEKASVVVWNDGDAEALENQVSLLTRLLEHDRI